MCRRGIIYSFRILFHNFISKMVVRNKASEITQKKSEMYRNFWHGEDKQTQNNGKEYRIICCLIIYPSYFTTRIHVLLFSRSVISDPL